MTGFYMKCNTGLKWVKKITTYPNCLIMRPRDLKTKALHFDIQTVD